MTISSYFQDEVDLVDPTKTLVFVVNTVSYDDFEWSYSGLTITGGSDLACEYGASEWLEANGYRFYAPDTSRGKYVGSPFNTTSGSNVVRVTQEDHRRVPGDVVTFKHATAFNNVNMNGTFTVDTVIDLDNFTVLASTTASGSGSGAGVNADVVTWHYVGAGNEGRFTIRPTSINTSLSAAKQDFWFPTSSIFLTYGHSWDLHYRGDGAVLNQALDRWQVLNGWDQAPWPAGHRWASIINANQAYFQAHPSYYIGTLGSNSVRFNLAVTGSDYNNIVMIAAAEILRVGLNTWNRTHMDATDGDQHTPDQFYPFTLAVATKVRAGTDAIGTHPPRAGVAGAQLGVYAYAGHRQAPTLAYTPGVFTQIALAFTSPDNWLPLAEAHGPKADALMLREYFAVNNEFPGADQRRKVTHFEQYDDFQAAGAVGFNAESSAYHLANLPMWRTALRKGRTGDYTMQEAIDEIVSDIYNDDPAARSLLEFLSDTAGSQEYSTRRAMDFVSEMETSWYKTYWQYYLTIIALWHRRPAQRPRVGTYGSNPFTFVNDSTTVTVTHTNHRHIAADDGTASNLVKISKCQPFSGFAGTLGSNPFTTTSGSTTVTVTHTNHGRIAPVTTNSQSLADYVTFPGASAVGGITISGTYQITGKTSEDTYTITHSSAATSSATGGGASVAYTYGIPTGEYAAVVTGVNSYTITLPTAPTASGSGGGTGGTWRWSTWSSNDTFPTVHTDIMKKVVAIRLLDIFHGYGYLRQESNGVVSTNYPELVMFQNPRPDFWLNPALPTEGEFAAEHARLVTRNPHDSYLDSDDLTLVFNITPVVTATAPCTTIFGRGCRYKFIGPGSLTTINYVDNVAQTPVTTTYAAGIHDVIGGTRELISNSGGYLFGVMHPLFYKEPYVPANQNTWVYVPTREDGSVVIRQGQGVWYFTDASGNYNLVDESLSTYVDPANLGPGQVKVLPGTTGSIQSLNINPYLSMHPNRQLMPTVLAEEEFPHYARVNVI